MNRITARKPKKLSLIIFALNIDLDLGLRQSNPNIDILIAGIKK
jgi:hypothetical protein